MMDDILIPRESPLRRSQPFVVVCEGHSDVRFVAALLKHRGIGNCNVGCPTSTTAEGDGRSNIPTYIKAIANNKKGLRGIFVVIDADRDPKEAFDFSARALSGPGFPVPDEPFQVHESGGMRTAVFLVPGKDKTGTMEHLFLEAALQKNRDAERCLFEFAKCTKASERWEDNPRAKMQIGALVAAFCHDDPLCSLSWIWNKKFNPIPIESECFKPLADLISTFSQL
jgi:hypothetical protein